MRTANLFWILCAGAAVAHPPARIPTSQFLEDFASGVVHVDRLTVQQGVSFVDGSAVFGSGGQLEFADPTLQGFAIDFATTPAFCDVALRVYDDPDAGASWEFRFVGWIGDAPPSEIPAILRIHTDGEALHIEFTSEWIQSNQSVPRAAGWIDFRSMSLHGEPQLERDGVDLQLHVETNWYLPDSVEISGSNFQVDEFVITPWFLGVSNESMSWGSLKARTGRVD